MKNLFESVKIKTDFARVELIIAFAPEKFSEAHNRGKHLAYNRCNGGTRNAQIEKTDKKKVENYVCDGSDYEETERAF